MIELRSGDNAVNGGACGRVSMFLPLFALTIKGWRYRQKAVVARLIGADGDASQKTSFPSCHHRHHQCCCGSHSGCVGWMEHESRRVLNLRRSSIYLIIYMSLCMGGIYGVAL